MNASRTTLGQFLKDMQTSSGWHTADNALRLAFVHGISPRCLISCVSRFCPINPSNYTVPTYSVHMSDFYQKSSLLASGGKPSANRKAFCKTVCKTFHKAKPSKQTLYPSRIASHKNLSQNPLQQPFARTSCV